MNKQIKRFLSISLVLVMLCSIFSVSVSAATFTITYYPGDGVIGDVYVDSFTRTIKLRSETYTREHYTQTGWSTTDGGALEYKFSSTYRVKKDIELYPVWIGDVHTITYLPDQYTNETEAITVESNYGSNIVIKSNVFTRDGYIQTGWSTVENSDVVEYELSGSIVVTDNMQLYPVWEPIVYDFIKTYENIDFGSICEGYTDEVQAVEVEITNNSNISAEITVPESEWYDITCSATTVAVGETFTIQISPKASLTAGEYAEQLTFGVNDLDANIEIDTSFTVVASEGHSFGDWVVTTEPTCTEVGSKCKMCSVCGYKNEIAEVPANGHDFIDSVCCVCGDCIFSYEITEEGITITGLLYPQAELVIPSVIKGTPVVAIGEEAFYQCDDITSIEIPEGVVSIGAGAFSSCSLSSISIPSSVESIGSAAFSFCNALTSINIVDIKAWCEIEFEDALANPLVDAYALIDIRDYVRRLYIDGNPVTELVLPDSVTSIGDFAFSGYMALESITIPDSVQTIGAGAFYYCAPLESVVIPDSVQTIEEAAFAYCAYLQYVTIGKGVTEIGDVPFACCSSLFDISVDAENTSYVSVDGVLFDKAMTELIQYPAQKEDTEYIIPDTVTSIDGYAFCEADKLVAVQIPDGMTSIGVQAFYSCSNLTSIAIPESVVAINAQTFEYCQSLETVTFTNSLESIGEKAFANCYMLSSIDIPDSVTSIGSEAFSSCTGLQTVVIGDGVTTIPERAFESCTALKSIVIGDNVESIGDYAFSPCLELVSVVIPKSVAFIGYGSFEYCNKIAYVFYAGSENEWNEISIDYNNSYLTDAVIHYNATDHTYSTEWTIDVAPTCITTGEKSRHCTVCDFKADITEIETTDVHAVAEYNKDFDTNIKTGVCDVCGNTVTLDMVSEDCLTFELNDDLVSYCVTNCYDSTTFTDIEIPATYNGLPVTYIGAAFYDNGNLTSVTIPDSVIGIRDNAFSGCYRLRNVVNSNKLTYIGNYAFAYCSNLRTITIPDSVTYIGDHAFDGCSSLVSLTIPEGVASINDYTFNDCESLASVVIPDSVTSIGEYAFYDCSGITSLTIGNGVTNIGEFAFAYCKNLTTITIPDNVTNIDEYAFYHCHNLKSATIGNGVSSIGGEALGYCYSLTTINVAEDNSHYTSVDGVLFDKDITRIVRYPIGKTDTSYSIPDGVISVDANAFQKCENLSSVIIPDSVTNIGDQAFLECEINTITLGEGVEQIGEDAFGDCTSLEYVVFSQLGIDDITKYFSFSITPTITSNSSSKFIGTGNEFTITCPNYNLEFTCVVKNDVNGDSVCDALDAWQVGLVSNGHTTLDGAYAMAADSNSDDIVDVTDYQSIVNKAVS